MNTTPNLALPYLQQNQSQKHVTLNEALRRLDAIAQINVSSRNQPLPPPEPENGQRFIPADGAQEAWEGHDGMLAIFHDGAWGFLTPRNGWLAFIEDEGLFLVHDDGSWRDVVATAVNPVAQVGINSVADTVNRLAVRSNASLFDHEGLGHQLKINKAEETATASCLFQSAYVGKAEMGLTGSDDFNLKISSDGVEFTTVMTVKTDTGFTGLGTDTPASRLHIRQDHDARLTIDTVQSGAGGGFDILNSTTGQNWRVTGAPNNFKLRDHSAMLDKFVLNVGATGSGFIINTPRFGIGTASPTTTLHVDGPARVGSYSRTGLPNAATSGAGAIIFVPDEAEGSVLAFSDGTNWRRATDRAILS